MVDWLSTPLGVHETAKDARKDASPEAKSRCLFIASDKPGGAISARENLSAKVRLLDSSVESRMLARQESFDSNWLEPYGAAPDRNEPLAKYEPLLSEVRGIRELLRRYEAKKVKADDREKSVREWRIIACATDRLFFVLYIAINVMGLLVILVTS